MHTQKINFEYLKILQEAPLFCKLILWKTLRNRKSVPATPGTVLLVNVSLVGEFAATATAMGDFIERNPEKIVDIMVSPALRPLAQKIQGVRHVFVATSVFGRPTEQKDCNEKTAEVFDSYAITILMRISPEAYRSLKTMQTGQMQTALPYLLGYGLHLLRCFIRRRVPRTWREVNFAILGGVPRDIPLENLFIFTEEEKRHVAHLPALQTKEKKVLVHTRASWVMNQWPLVRWEALLKELGAIPEYRFIFVGSKAEMEDYQHLTRQVATPLYSLIGETSVAELLLVMRQCDSFIGVDSGPSNLAHLARLPSITLFGPGPHMYMPHDPQDIALDHSCGRGVYQRFFYTKKNRIIDKISVTEVRSAFARLTLASEAWPTSGPTNVQEK